jgi:hypothetical protein
LFFSSFRSTGIEVKLKILAYPNFLSAIFSKKLFCQMFMKTYLALPVRSLLKPKPTKIDSLVKLSYTKQAKVMPCAFSLFLIVKLGNKFITKTIFFWV